MTFDVGDKVVYPHHGAATIERREKKEAFGEKRDYLVLRLAYGDLTATLNVSESSWWQIPVTVAQSVVYTGLVVLVARWMRLRSTTSPPRDEPEQSTGPAVATA